MAAAFFDHHSQGLNCGSINIPPLCELFPATMDYRFGREDEPSSDASSVPILGGFDEGALRSCLRPSTTTAERKRQQLSTTSPLVADLRFPDPVCILTSDYSAALSDSPPMRACAYPRLLSSKPAVPRARLSAPRPRGSEGDSPLIEHVSPPPKTPEAPALPPGTSSASLQPRNRHAFAAISG